jgi:prepilin-type N-terminal cleavage/methylation domain-containing protein
MDMFPGVASATPGNFLLFLLVDDDNDSTERGGGRQHPPADYCRRDTGVMKQYIEKRDEKGFTLIELLIAIVVVGILAAVAIVGIAGLTNTGAKSACTQSLDSAKAASAAYYANQTPNAWPVHFQDMATVAPVAPATSPVNNPVVYEPPAGSKWEDATLTANPMVLHGNGWFLTMSFPNGAGTEPAFACT